MLKLLNNHLFKRRSFYVKVSSGLSSKLVTKCTRISAPNKQFSTCSYKSAKVFQDTENIYAYQQIASTFSFKDYPNNSPDSHVESSKDFETILAKHWRTSSATDILQAFKAVSNYSSSNSIALSDSRFRNLVDGLMDNVEHLTYDEIAELLTVLSKFPATESYTSDNFHDVWSALDDICVWRMHEWNVDQLFKLADLWYNLSLGRIGDYIFEFINRFEAKPHQLTPKQLVQIFFFLNVCRRKKVVFAFEHALQQHIDSLSVDEMSVVALGYFKTQTKVKTPYILECMMNAVKENAGNVHELSLCALLKVIRFSANVHIADQMHDLLEHIYPQIERLSLLCCLHIAIFGTTLQVFHEKSLQKVSEKFVKHISDTSVIRLKDMERILLALTMFNYDPKTAPDIFQSIYAEMHNERRAPEIARYPRCLPAALSFLSIKNIYSAELMNKVLEKSFIVDTYGKSAKQVPREIFLLNLSSEIECPDYKGNRLGFSDKYKAAKWLTDFTPEHNQLKKLSNAEKLILSVTDCVAQIVGTQFMFVHHVLPHFAKSDIVLCVDKKTNKYVKPLGFDNYILGDVMKPFDTTNFDWYAIVPVSWNLTIRNTNIPVGIVNMRKRQLLKLGYKPIFIIWNEYLHLTLGEQQQFVARKLREAQGQR